MLEEKRVHCLSKIALVQKEITFMNCSIREIAGNMDNYFCVGENKTILK
jgi:hypothetical protein